MKRGRGRVNIRSPVLSSYWHIRGEFFLALGFGVLDVEEGANRGIVMRLMRDGREGHRLAHTGLVEYCGKR